eukprot:10687587-Alexandrium_andersonii.AAC.1
MDATQRGGAKQRAEARHAARSSNDPPPPPEPLVSLDPKFRKKRKTLTPEQPQQPTPEENHQR